MIQIITSYAHRRINPHKKNEKNIRLSRWKLANKLVQIHENLQHVRIIDQKSNSTNHLGILEFRGQASWIQIYTTTNNELIHQIKEINEDEKWTA